MVGQWPADSLPAGRQSAPTPSPVHFQLPSGIFLKTQILAFCWSPGEHAEAPFVERVEVSVPWMSPMIQVGELPVLGSPQHLIDLSASLPSCSIKNSLRGL